MRYKLRAILAKHFSFLLHQHVPVPSSYRLHEVGKGDALLLQGNLNAVVDCNITTVDENLAKARSPHCSYCGHPGSKRTHLKVACVFCNVYGHEKCTQKPVGFKCECSSCDKVHH